MNLAEHEGKHNVFTHLMTKKNETTFLIEKKLIVTFLIRGVMIKMKI